MSQVPGENSKKIEGAPYGRMLAFLLEFSDGEKWLEAYIIEGSYQTPGKRYRNSKVSMPVNEVENPAALKGLPVYAHSDLPQDFFTEEF